MSVVVFLWLSKEIWKQYITLHNNLEMGNHMAEPKQDVKCDIKP